MRNTSNDLLISNLQRQDKDINPFRITKKVRSLFLSGGKYTARDINELCNTNDARKIISDLRRSGMNIKDLRLDSGCKLYFLEADPMQTTLNFDSEL